MSNSDSSTLLHCKISKYSQSITTSIRCICFKYLFAFFIIDMTTVYSVGLSIFSQNGDMVSNGQGIRIATEAVTEQDLGDVWLIPGGGGTRPLAKDERFLVLLRQIAEKSEYCLTVCTGSALLAKCGALDGRRATSNKIAFDWVVTMSDKVSWIYDARWVEDGKFFTSAGVSAGIDMALGFVSHLRGEKEAENIARKMEYTWNRGRG